ncbi:uncharacterized protein LOC125384325 [Haliotis rufescens]|uniref:uncharacterized protein LOC125384325 n=1 Tax=Haliotis rufescens TaxID=6454 RepID=UPI00201F3230|nr:uncharacterized protein LOC125384325 [Haliotis rufescens]
MFGHRISKTCIYATAIALVHIYCVQHQGIFAKENCNNSTSSTWNIYRLIDRLQWKSFATIQDKDEEAVFPHPVKQQVYNVNRINSSRVMESIHSLMFPEVNIIMAVNDSSTLEVVAEVIII